MNGGIVNGRERMDAVLHGRRADRLCWTTLVDGPTLDALPDGWRGLSAVDFYKRLGCDVLQLGGWGTPYEFLSPSLKWAKGVEETGTREGNLVKRRWKSAAGELAGIFHVSGHPVKHPVETPVDLRLYRDMWEGARYGKVDDGPAFEGARKLVGEAGVVTRMWGPSTVPRLLEYDMGMENFYTLLGECPEDMEALLAVMHARELEAFKALAEGPCEIVILTENTSTYYISPEVYRKHNGPHVADFVDAMHGAGKVAIIHMCGHIKGILDLVRNTGLDGVHALTPPPTGDTSYAMALDELGEDKAVIGALDPTIFISGPIAGIGPALDAIYTTRLRRAPFILCPFADGIPVQLERFQAVARWMERNGGPATGG